jgi:hypothetical protein
MFEPFIDLMLHTTKVKSSLHETGEHCFFFRQQEEEEESEGSTKSTAVFVECNVPDSRFVSFCSVSTKPIILIIPPNFDGVVIATRK